MLSFIDFLKKYSIIPNEFLDDFFKLSNYKDCNNNEINIDLDDVVK